MIAAIINGRKKARYRHDPDFTVMSSTLLTCDNDSCSKKDPSVTCPDCESFYYCSTKCRSEHWDGPHLHECRMYSCEPSNEPILGEPLPEAEEPKKAVGVNDQCGICFSDVMVRPMGLSCGHVFCAFCIGSLQSKHFRPPPIGNACPYCRVTMDSDIHRDATDHSQALVYFGQSLWDCDFLDGAKAMFRLAIVQMERLLEMEPNHTFTHVYMASVLMRTTEDPFEALQITNHWIEKAAKLAMHDFLQRNPTYRKRPQFIDQRIIFAQSNEAAGLYGQAMSLFEAAKGHPDYELEVAKGLSRTAYHLGDYKAAIGFMKNFLFEPARTQVGIHQLVAKPLVALYEQAKANETNTVKDSRRDFGRSDSLRILPNTAWCYPYHVPWFHVRGSA